MLIAKKPCSFGGKRFFIGDRIPDEMVIDPKAQAGYGVLTIREEIEAEPKAPKAEPKEDKPKVKKGKAAKAADEGAGEA